MTVEETLRSELAETSAILEWCGAAVMGEYVGDFGMSFQIVREVADLKQNVDLASAEIGRLKEENERLGKIEKQARFVVECFNEPEFSEQRSIHGCLLDLRIALGAAPDAEKGEK